MREAAGTIHQLARVVPGLPAYIRCWPCPAAPAHCACLKETGPDLAERYFFHAGTRYGHSTGPNRADIVPFIDRDGSERVEGLTHLGRGLSCRLISFPD